MWSQLTWWDRVLGTWAVAAGVSLLWTFFKQYRRRGRYVYLLFFGVWAVFLGIGVLRHEPLVPRFAMWALFLLGAVSMLGDSVRRYRETYDRLREERTKRLRDGH